MTKYAGYHIDGSKAQEFKIEAMKLFSNPEIKKELMWRMCNFNKETNSFDINCGLPQQLPKEILALAQKFGTGFNSYA